MGDWFNRRGAQANSAISNSGAVHNLNTAGRVMNNVGAQINTSITRSRPLRTLHSSAEEFTRRITNSGAVRSMHAAGEYLNEHPGVGLAIGAGGGAAIALSPFIVGAASHVSLSMYVRAQVTSWRAAAWIAKSPLGRAVGSALGTAGGFVQRNWQRVKDAVLPSVSRGSGQTITGQYNPLNRGPLSMQVSNTFRSATYNEAVLNRPLTVYRVIGPNGDPSGRFWTRVSPSGPTQSILDSALNPQWGNNALYRVRAVIPSGTRIYEGIAGPQGGLLGGGNQIYIPLINPSWIKGIVGF